MDDCGGVPRSLGIIDQAIVAVALTNAADFSDKAKRRARDYGVILIARRTLREWPVGCL